MANFAYGVVLTMDSSVDVSGGNVSRTFQMLYNATNVIKNVSYVEPSGNTVTGFPLQPGWNPIAGTQINQTGTTFVSGELYAPTELAY